MIKTNLTLRNFTHNEFQSLTKKEINEMIEDKIPFLVSEIITLENGFTYCLARESLYNKDEKITLTKIESKLLNLLILNINKIVDYQTIKDLVWKGKNMSRFTMRNKIKDIRDISYPEIIRNDSNIGYSISDKV